MRIKPVSMLSGLLLLLALPLAANADLPGKHPYYLHALSDLRTARWMLEHRPGDPAVSAQEDVAITEIDKAIGEIKKASIDDGKGLNDPFTIDTHLSPHDRFRKANELLWAAHNDLSKAEDVPESRGLRDRAIGHVDKAHQIVDTAQSTARWE